MIRQALQLERNRKLLVGVVAPLAIVVPITALGFTRPSVGFFGLMGAAVVGALLFMAIANDMRAQNYLNRSTVGGSAGAGLDATAQPHEERNVQMNRITGTLQVFGAGLGTVALLALAVFLVVV